MGEDDDDIGVDKIIGLLLSSFCLFVYILFLLYSCLHSNLIINVKIISVTILFLSLLIL